MASAEQSSASSQIPVGSASAAAAPQLPAAPAPAAASHAPVPGAAPTTTHENPALRHERTFADCLALLPPAQKLAVLAITDGQRYEHAAAVAGVSRDALYDWRTRDYHFIAAIDAWRRESAQRVAATLQSLRAPAVRNVLAAVENGTLKLSKAKRQRLEELRAILDKGGTI